MHTAPTQVWLVHGAAATQVPFAPHVSGVLPLHCVCPGAQTPVHTPLMHVWLLHAVVPPQLPLALHVWVLLPRHWREPGEQVTQLLWKHTGVGLEQVASQI